MQKCCAKTQPQSEKINQTIVRLQRNQHTSIGGLLNSVSAGGVGQKVGVVWETKEQRGLLHHLEDRVLDGRSVGSWKRAQVHGDDSDAVRELFDVFPRRIERVKVIQVRQRTAFISIATCNQHAKTHLKKLDVPPILYPMTRRRSRVPSTSKTSMTGP